jgi:hypothetical protein
VASVHLENLMTVSRVMTDHSVNSTIESRVATDLHLENSMIEIPVAARNVVKAENSAAKAAEDLVAAVASKANVRSRNSAAAPVNLVVVAADAAAAAVAVVVDADSFFFVKIDKKEHCPRF